MGCDQATKVMRGAKNRIDLREGEEDFMPIGYMRIVPLTFC